VPEEGGRLTRRLRRILVMLPFIIAHPGVTTGELADRFNVKRRDLLADLELVFLCGLPGYGPGDLIEVHLDDDRVTVDMADYFKNPLRITPDEALTLYLGGAAAVRLMGPDQADALESALGKLGAALGSGTGQPAIEIELEAGSTSHFELLQEALEAGQRIEIEYLSASTGELGARAVDPWGLIAALGHWYLVGLDHRSEEERLFRTDRMRSVRVLDEPAEIPDDFDPDTYRGAFTGRGETVIALEISARAATWFEDYYPVRSSTVLDDGWRRVELVAGGSRWAATLVVRLGADARNVVPEEVATAARLLAQTIAARHGWEG
jgi:proteasome accessory factor C